MSTKMAKKPAQPATPKAAAPPINAHVAQSASRAPSATHTKSASASNSTLSAKSSPQEVALHVWHKYLDDTPTRTMLLDVFMLFLVLVGAVQFLYCLLVGNYVSNYARGLERSADVLLAIQCLPLWFWCMRWPVCPHSFAANANIRTTSTDSICRSEEGCHKVQRRRL